VSAVPAPHALDNPELWDVKSMPLNGYRIITARRGVITWIVKRPIKAWTNDPWTATKMRGGRVLEERQFQHLPEALRRYA
jgi:hypothetical protein